MVKFYAHFSSLFVKLSKDLKAFNITFVFLSISLCHGPHIDTPTIAGSNRQLLRVNASSHLTGFYTKVLKGT